MTPESLSEKRRKAALAGGGRPKGSVSEETRMRQESLHLIQRRVAEATGHLINAQIGSAIGSQYLFKKYKDDDPVRVTDPEEMEAYLRGDFEKSEDNPHPTYFYFLTAKDPETRASEALFNRLHGRPKESIDISNPDGSLKGLTIVKNYGTDTNNKSSN